MTLLRLNLRRGESTLRFGTHPEWLDFIGNPVTENDVATAIAGKRVLALVHGYNVTEAIDAYAVIAAMVSFQYDTVIGVTWPGSRIALAFWFAEMRANKAGRLMAAALHKRVKAAAAFDIEGHSLGCRVALESLSSGLDARLLLLAAPAIDHEAVEIGEEYGSVIEGRTHRTLVAHSSNDAVLRGAYKIAEWDTALGLYGPRNPVENKDVLLPFNLEVINLSDTVKSHSGYKKSSEFYSVWRGWTEIAV